MNRGLEAARRALDLLNGVLAKRPHKDDHALAITTEVIAAADEHGIAMVFTGMRHFRH